MANLGKSVLGKHQWDSSHLRSHTGNCSIWPDLGARVSLRHMVRRGLHEVGLRVVHRLEKRRRPRAAVPVSHMGVLFDEKASAWCRRQRTEARTWRRVAQGATHEMSWIGQ